MKFRQILKESNIINEDVSLRTLVVNMEKPGFSLSRVPAGPVFVDMASKKLAKPADISLVARKEYIDLDKDKVKQLSDFIEVRNGPAPDTAAAAAEFKKAYSRSPMGTPSFSR